ncbi:MAG TPA: prepilin-type N-terminal cleavage/methylation domain-containing protein [Candidatus Saccharimonadales bacterium]|nr:prepilin-type N-terminal cleavage/methylation domain-containing protein [Candidatus Saccharimonadales bacterium]
MSRLRNNKGFTLIELVIVLAIAALILAAILLAVTGAQKSRRDSQRKTDLGQISAELEQYGSNNSGNYPATQAAFNTAFKSGASYNNANWIDPLSGSAYDFAGAQAPTTGQPAGIAYTLAGRTYTICINLEVGGTNCISNQ